MAYARLRLTEEKKHTVDQKKAREVGSTPEICVECRSHGVVREDVCRFITTAYPFAFFPFAPGAVDVLLDHLRGCKGGNQLMAATCLQNLCGNAAFKTYLYKKSEFPPCQFFVFICVNGISCTQCGAAQHIGGKVFSRRGGLRQSSR